MLARRIKRILLPLCVVMAGCFFTARCTFEKPSAPTWDVNLAVPLADKTYTMEELAGETDLLNIEGTDQIIFSLEEDFETFEIGEFLKLSGAEKTFSITVPAGQSQGYELTQSDTLVLPDSIVVDHALLNEGRVDVVVNNGTSYHVSIEIEIPALQFGGNPLPLQADIIPGVNTWGLDLTGAEFTPGDEKFSYSATVRIIPGGSNVQGGDVDITVRISDLVFGEITGRLNGVEVDFEETELDVGIPDELEGFAIGSLDLKLAMQVGFVLPIWVDLRLEPINPLVGSPSDIIIQEWIIPSGLYGVDTLDIGDVADFVNSQPERIRITGSFRLGDGSTSISISDTSTIRASVLFEAPMIFTLPDQTTETEPDTLEIDEDTREIIRENLRSVLLQANVENHLPFGVEVTLFFDDTRGDSLLYTPGFTPDLTIGPLVVSQSATGPDPENPGTQVATVPTQSQLSIDLDENQVGIFDNEIIFQGTRITILGTGGEMVRVRVSDYIRIRANLSGTIRTNIPEEDDGEGGGA